MTEATFTIRVDQDLKEKFTAAAKAKDRSGAQLVRDFMRDFVHQQQKAVEHDAWFRRQVRIGLDSAIAGGLVSTEEVEAEATAWREETRQKLASSGS